MAKKFKFTLNKCSFAHGIEELREKSHLNTNFKTKPCRSYFINSYCNYGNRCQYLHSDLIYEPHYKPFLLKAFRDKKFSKEKLKSLESFVSYSEQLALLLEGKCNLSEIYLFNCPSLIQPNGSEENNAF